MCVLGSFPGFFSTHEPRKYLELIGPCREPYGTYCVRSVDLEQDSQTLAHCAQLEVLPECRSSSQEVKSVSPSQATSVQVQYSKQTAHHWPAIGAPPSQSIVFSLWRTEFQWRAESN